MARSADSHVLDRVGDDLGLELRSRLERVAQIARIERMQHAFLPTSIDAAAGSRR